MLNDRKKQITKQKKGGDRRKLAKIIFNDDDYVDEI